jgi:hypothetical protein
LYKAPTLCPMVQHRGDCGPVGSEQRKLKGSPQVTLQTPTTFHTWHGLALCLSLEYNRGLSFLPCIRFHCNFPLPFGRLWVSVYEDPSDVLSIWPDDVIFVLIAYEVC